MTAFLLMLVLVLLGGCGQALSRTAVHAERALEAGSNAWDTHVESVIDGCRAKDLPTEEARAECVGDLKAQNAHVEKAMTAAVIALRGYWIAVAAGASNQELQSNLAAVLDALDDLPPEYFGGVLNMLNRELKG